MAHSERHKQHHVEKNNLLNQTSQLDKAAFIMYPTGWGRGF